MAVGLNVIGQVLQLVGAVIAIYGLLRTHDEFADMPMRRRLQDRARQTYHRVKWGFLRRIGRGQRTSGYAQVGLEFSLGVKARGRVGWGPIPVTTKPALAELDRRTRDLSNRLADATERLDDEIEALRKELQTASEAVAASVAEVERLARHVATGGIRYEAIGLFLVIAGLAMQGLAVVVGQG